MLPDHLTECWQLRRLEITRLVPHHHLNRKQSQGHQQSSDCFLLESCDEEETACYAYTALHYAALYLRRAGPVYHRACRGTGCATCAANKTQQHQVMMAHTKNKFSKKVRCVAIYTVGRSLQAHPAVATNTAQGLHAEEIDSLRHGHADSSEVIMMTDCPPTPQQHIQYSIQLRSVLRIAE